TSNVLPRTRGGSLGETCTTSYPPIPRHPRLTHSTTARETGLSLRFFVTHNRFEAGSVNRLGSIVFRQSNSTHRDCNLLARGVVAQCPADEVAVEVVDAHSGVDNDVLGVDAARSRAEQERGDVGG